MKTEIEWSEKKSSEVLIRVYLIPLRNAFIENISWTPFEMFHLLLET